MTPPTILIATLGGTWQVIPEIVAALSPERCALYRHHANQAALLEVRTQCGVEQLDELWIITSNSEKTKQGMQAVEEWNTRLIKPFTLRFFIAEKTHEVTTPQELENLRELIFRVVLHANEQGHVVCSLAGGRKTMSADLQRAASLFGAQGLLHIVAPEPLPDELKNSGIPFWCSPLPEHLASQLLPAFVGNYKRRESLDADLEGDKKICSANYPLVNSNHFTCHFNPDNNNLVDDTEQREKNAQQLLSNYLADIAKTERHENWRHLYRLSPAHIRQLRETMLSEQHEPLIKQLPKAELHCHIGGLLTLSQQIAVGQAIWNSLDADRQAQLIHQIAPLLQQTNWPWSWPQNYLRNQPSPVIKAEVAAAILTQAGFEKLNANLYGITMPRISLKDSEHGFSAYERPGELSGSAVLGHPAALPAYVGAIKNYTQSEAIRYLELRGSPQKYQPDNPAGWLLKLQDLLAEDTQCQYRFIWILDRRSADIADVIKQAVEAKRNSTLNQFLVGLDVAGDEKHSEPKQLAQYFTPAFEECLPVTIHAGEGESAENIWQAAYHLHADRIGHGLSLADNPELLKRFRNRGICLELCPTSNKEVIGYHDPRRSDFSRDNCGSDDCRSDFSRDNRSYPIAELWRSGVPLTINTDNPGISSTTLTNEYLVAARMSESPFSLWDVLAMIKQSFVHAMASSEEREEMLKKIDAEIFKQISDWL